MGSPGARSPIFSPMVGSTPRLILARLRPQRRTRRRARRRPRAPSDPGVGPRYAAPVARGMDALIERRRRSLAASALDHLVDLGGRPHVGASLFDRGTSNTTMTTRYEPWLCDSPVAWADPAPDRPSGPTSACRRCQRPAPPLDEPSALYWGLIVSTAMSSE